MTRAVVFALGLVGLVGAGYSLWRLVHLSQDDREGGGMMFWLFVAAMGILLGGAAIGGATREWVP